MTELTVETGAIITIFSDREPIMSKYGDIPKLTFSMVTIDTRGVMLIHSLIEAIADAKGKEPDDLEAVLEEHISMEAIQQLDDHASELWTLQFELPNHTVQVSGDGTILVDGT